MEFAITNKNMVFTIYICFGIPNLLLLFFLLFIDHLIRNISINNCLYFFILIILCQLFTLFSYLFTILKTVLSVFQIFPI